MAMSTPEDASSALREMCLNPTTQERGNDLALECAHCRKEGATKRCAKRHAKCAESLFCDKSCEIAAHKKKEEEKGKEEEENVDSLKAVVSGGEKASKAKAKKAKKAANAAKKKGDGELWWNNSVYASW